MSDVLTTGEAARICGVNFRTVLRWIERGLLQAYKLPGRGDRRVLRGELHRFMLEHAIPDRSTSTSTPSAPARRVLIVDDEPAMAHAIERVLLKDGFETAIAANGFEAGTMLPTFKPRIMTLDLRMPGLDGLEVLRFLQRTELPAPVKVLVMSADTEERLREALTLGAHGILRKPFTNAELREAVEKMYLIPSISN